MLMRLSAVSSLFLAFAISGCGLFDDYELAFKKPPEKGDKSFTVLIKEKGKSDTLKDGDGSKLKVTISVKCGDADAVENSGNAEAGEVTIAIKEDALPGKKGDKCTVEATADDAKSAEAEFDRGD